MDSQDKGDGKKISVLRGLPADPRRKPQPPVSSAPKPLEHSPAGKTAEDRVTPSSDAAPSRGTTTSAHQYLRRQRHMLQTPRSRWTSWKKFWRSGIRGCGWLCQPDQTFSSAKHRQTFGIIPWCGSASISGCAVRPALRTNGCFKRCAHKRKAG